MKRLFYQNKVFNLDNFLYYETHTLDNGNDENQLEFIIQLYKSESEFFYLKVCKFINNPSLKFIEYYANEFNFEFQNEIQHHENIDISKINKMVYSRAKREVKNEISI